jgi:hypothetical protein
VLKRLHHSLSVSVLPGVNLCSLNLRSKLYQGENDPWRLMAWYGEANRSPRYRTWDMMCFLKTDSDLSWLCLGDFNEVLRRQEQMGPNERKMAGINLFREVVDACRLCDIGYVGLDWTF